MMVCAIDNVWYFVYCPLHVLLLFSQAYEQFVKNFWSLYNAPRIEVYDQLISIIHFHITCHCSYTTHTHTHAHTVPIVADSDSTV